MVVGLALVAAGLDTVASTASAPPDSDGFIQGLAYLFALILGVSGLLAVQIGYALPAGTGRLRVGPLADRSAGARAGVTVLLYALVVLVMVYGVPAVVPSVTESTTYATGLFFVAIATVVGAVLALLFALAGAVLRVARRRSSGEDNRTAT